MKNDEIRLECVRLAWYATSRTFPNPDNVLEIADVLKTASDIYDWILGKTDKYEPVAPNNV